MPNNNHFAWAQGNNPNIKRPEHTLIQNGWVRGDTPMASNFNWMFKQISDELTTLRKHADNQARQLKAQQKKLNALGEDHANFKTSTKRKFKSQEKEFVFLKGLLVQTFRGLNWLCENIKSFHPQLPPHPWQGYKSEELERFFKEG